ncbi:MAG: signal peptide peptidase SppA [Desulfovibrionaceae bacterium]|nr:signal peptide peptidase SppA [Desulfovibrionaceae bacterium]
MQQARPGFSQKHPFVFGSLMLIMAVALVMGAMALFRSCAGDGAGGLSAWSGERLGQVLVEGVIMDAQDEVDWIRELMEDDSVKGVLLRINSPGGAIAPSQELHQAVRRLAGVKPVVASFGTVAASGGYYAAAAATFIMANPGSITANIGVKVEYLTFEGILDKWGIRQELLSSGVNKAAGSPFKALTPEQRAYFMGLITDTHDQFVSDVAKSRKLDKARVALLSDGRAMTGRQALAAGLVDGLGGRQEALDKLKALCGITEKVPLVKGPPEKRPLWKRIVGALGLEPESLAWSPGWVFSYK